MLHFVYHLKRFKKQLDEYAPLTWPCRNDTADWVFAHFSSLIVNNVVIVNSSGSKGQLTVGPISSASHLSICIFFYISQKNVFLLKFHKQFIF